MSQLKWQVMQWAGRLVKYATLKRLSDKFGFGYVTPPAEDPSEVPPDQVQTLLQADQRVRFMQWFGFRSRPVIQGGECIIVAPRGGTTNAVAVAADNLNHGPINLKEGESVQYGIGGSTVLHDQAGNVVVNSGTLKVARETDPCWILNTGKLAVWMQQVEGILNGSPGVVSPLSGTFLTNPGIAISDGAPKFKG